jgi:hypothetical protein
LQAAEAPEEFAEHEAQYIPGAEKSVAVAAASAAAIAAALDFLPQPCYTKATMRTIINKPKNKSGLIRAIRNLFEHRALWMYLLLDEARKKGLAPEDFAPAAIKRCGLYQGGAYAENGSATSLKLLRKRLFTGVGKLIFEMKIRRCTDDNLDVDFHYCPLVSAWQKQGCAGKDLANLCEYAMCGDRGIAESFGCDLDLVKTIAQGNGVCEIRFRRRETVVSAC